jgi:hypothetical protein
MNTDMNTVRLLGAAQLIVIVGNLVMDSSLSSAVGSGSIAVILANISRNLTQMRISSLVALGQTLAILVMGVLYYVLFCKQYQPIALVALGCFLIAAIALVVGKIGASALVPLSHEFVSAGSSETASLQTLGDFLYYGVDRRGSEIHMLFLSLGFLLTNYLFFTSRIIPRAISIWGLAAICLLMIPTLLTLYDREFLPGAVVLALPYAPY